MKTGEKTYLLQVTTKDNLLQLRTEVTSTTLNGLYIESKKMVKAHPEVKGLKYIVGFYTKRVVSGFDWETLKVDTIAA